MRERDQKGLHQNPHSARAHRFAGHSERVAARIRREEYAAAQVLIACRAWLARRAVQ